RVNRSDERMRLVVMRYDDRRQWHRAPPARVQKENSAMLNSASTVTRKCRAAATSARGLRKKGGRSDREDGDPQDAGRENDAVSPPLACRTRREESPSRLTASRSARRRTRNHAPSSRPPDSRPLRLGIDPRKGPCRLSDRR